MLINEFLELFFPSKCAVCGKLTGRGADEAPFCEDCRALLKDKMNERCDTCGHIVSDCKCIPQALASSGFLFHSKLFIYRTSLRHDPANRLIYRMKSSSEKRLYRAVAGELAKSVGERISAYAAERSLSPVITYVPRSVRSIRKYGNDQALLLAYALADELGIKCVTAVKRKHTSGKEMKKLSAEERFLESTDIFEPVQNDAIGTNTLLIIVDDIITTGASVCAVSDAVRKIGVTEFGALSVGRTY